MNEGSPRFPTTAWSIVVSAGRDSAESGSALAALCATYWYPIYAYIRGRGYSPDDAGDLTQDFFARLLEKRAIHQARRERGRFRWFLLASVRNFLTNEWDRANAQKRGGGAAMLSLDMASAEGRYGLEPSHELTPEKLYERQWALDLLARVLGRLAGEFAAKGKSARFEAMRPYLAGEPEQRSYASLARELDVSEGAVKVAVHRVRTRYRELLREEIAATVAEPGEIDDEIRYLLEALA